MGGWDGWAATLQEVRLPCASHSATLHSAANRRDSFMSAYINKTRFEIREISQLSDNVKRVVYCVRITLQLVVIYSAILMLVED